MEYGSIIDHRRLANNENAFCDVHFIVDEKNTIYGHSYIISERLPQLLDDSNPAIKRKKKKKITTVELNKSELITPEALYRVLVYGYCGQIHDIDKRTFTPFKAVEVIRAATIFKIDRLNQICQHYLKSNLSMDNIFKLLKHTDQMKAERAKQICMEFTLENTEHFSSENSKFLGVQLYQEILNYMLKVQRGQKPVSTPITVTEEDTIVEDFKRVYSSKDTKDITFLIQGEEIKAHKSILFNQSPEFTTFINQYEDGKDEKKKVGFPVVLEDKYSNVSPQAFDVMLRQFYYSEQEMDILHACQLFMFARDYNLAKLSLLISKVIGSGKTSTVSVLPILDVAYSPLMDDNRELQSKLKEAGMKFVIQNMEKIDFTPLQHMSPRIASQILVQLQQAIGSTWRIMAQAASKKNTSSSDSPRDSPELSSARSETPKLRVDSEDTQSSEKGEDGLKTSKSEGKLKYGKAPDSARSRNKSNKKKDTTSPTSTKKKK